VKSLNVQIPLGEPDPTRSTDHLRLPQVRRLSGQVGSGRVGSGPCPYGGIWHRPDQTLSLVGSGGVVSKFHYTDRTRHVRACDQVSDKVCDPCQIPLHGPTDFVCDPTRPDQTHGQSPYMSRSSGQVYDQTKSVRTCAETQAVGGSGLVGSGRVRVVEFSNDTTSDKVWPRPSSGIWTLHHTGRSALLLPDNCPAYLALSDSFEFIGGL